MLCCRFFEYLGDKCYTVCYNPPGDTAQPHCSQCPTSPRLTHTEPRSYQNVTPKPVPPAAHPAAETKPFPSSLMGTGCVFQPWGRRAFLALHRAGTSQGHCSAFPTKLWKPLPTAAPGMAQQLQCHLCVTLSHLQPWGQSHCRAALTPSAHWGQSHGIMQK